MIKDRIYHLMNSINAAVTFQYNPHTGEWEYKRCSYNPNNHNEYSLEEWEELEKTSKFIKKKLKKLNSILLVTSSDILAPGPVLDKEALEKAKKEASKIN